MSAKVLLSFLAIYLIWGSTFTAIKWGLESFPPFMLASMRFMLAGLIFALLTKGRGFGLMKRADYLREFVIGIFITAANAGVCWSEQYISSGVAALIVGAIPIWFIIFNWIGFEKKAPAISAMVALIIGMAGIALISVDDVNAPDLLVVVGLGVANCLWVMGSLMIRSKPTEYHYYNRASVQLVGGSLVLAAVSALLGEQSQSVTTAALLSVFYLAIAGTIIAYSAYAFLLKTMRPEVTSTYALVNPLLAMFLGVIWLNEPFTMRLAVATILILMSVTLVLYGPKLAPKQRINQR
jgi:drug/metabolite transporter (DMT)-like permease